MDQVHLKIYGDVQGVFFRAESRDVARSLGLTGWAKNTPGSGVEILAQGERKKLEELIRWCHKGSDASKVEKVEVIWEAPGESFQSFDIRYD